MMSSHGHNIDQTYEFFYSVNLDIFMKYYFLDFNANFLTNSNPEAEQIDREMDKNDSIDTKIGITQSVLTAKTDMVYILQ